MAGFSTWYHRTLRETVPLIEQGGLTAANYGPDPHGLGSPYHVLFQRREAAESWAPAGTGTGAIVTVRVPDDQRAEYLTCPGVPCYCDGAVSGLFKPLPAGMVWTAEDI